MQKIFLDGLGLDLADAVHGQALYDIQILTHYLGDIDRLPQIKGVKGWAMRTADDFSDAFLSAGCTASLCGYRREGAPWRYMSAERKSIRGGQLIEALDDLRAAIAQLQGSIDKANWIRGERALVRAIALTALALDAIDDDHLALYIRLSGIPGNVADIVGAALRGCEDHFAAPGSIPPRRLTANPERATVLPPARRRLTANPARSGAAA